MNRAAYRTNQYVLVHFQVLEYYYKIQFPINTKIESISFVQKFKYVYNYYKIQFPIYTMQYNTK